MFVKVSIHGITQHTDNKINISQHKWTCSLLKMEVLDSLFLRLCFLTGCV
jgi:hypothetical protein